MDSCPTISVHRKKSLQSRQVTVRPAKTVDARDLNASVSVHQRSITVANMNDIHSSMTRSSHSRASDTSSAYSGSDVMQSSTNGEDGLLINTLENSLGHTDDVGLSRCISVNETDDESEASSEVSTVVNGPPGFYLCRLSSFASIHFPFMITYASP